MPPATRGRASTERCGAATAPAPSVDETDPREKSFRRRFADWYFLPEKEHIPHAERWYADRHEMATLAAIGLFVGCASVLTGTGGPLILIPVLMTWKGAEMNRKVIVGCTSVTAGFLACAATVSLLAAGVTPDAGLVLLIAPWQTIFWLCGAAAVLLGFWGIRLPETLADAQRRPLRLTELRDAGRRSHRA